jgi:hypothetical protein
VRENGNSERGTGGRQASSRAVARPSTAPEVRREHDTPPAEEEQVQRWLEWEQQEWARLRAGRDQHLVDGEQPSQACSAAKESAEERLAVRWHSLPTPYLFELADVPYTLLAQASGAETIALVERNLKKKRVQLRRNQERRGGGGGTAPASPQESEEEAVKVINALLDWCRGELFPFLVEVDARMAGADPVARASFCYQTLIHPLREISRQKTVTGQNPESRADA